MTASAKRFVLALLCAVLSAAARADQLSDDLNQEYQKRVLGVRQAIHNGNQEFDNAGNPVNPGPAPAWEIYGGVLIDKLSLKNDRLRIDGMRVASPGPTEQGKGEVIPMGKVQFDIHLDRPLSSMEETRAVLGRVFYLDENDDEHRKPELRRTGSSAPNPVMFKAVSKTPGFVPPKPHYTPEPEFSEGARRAGFQGTVLLSLLIDTQGAVVAVKLDRGLGHGLDENAMETVKNWRFSPASSNGAPVSVWMNRSQLHVWRTTQALALRFRVHQAAAGFAQNNPPIGQSLQRRTVGADQLAPPPQTLFAFGR
jgi:TonB family protein